MTLLYNIFFPSGVNVLGIAFPEKEVKRLGEPPVTGRVKTPMPPSRLELNAMVFESGDQIG